jgi:MFS family permease
VHALGRRLRDAVAAYATVLRGRNLRRVVLAYAVWTTAEWAAFVALSLFAYTEGGTLGVGVVGFIRMLPAALATPFGAVLSDRFRRERVLFALTLGNAVALTASSAAFFGGRNETLIYGLAGILGILATLGRPTLSAVLPSLATTPEELVASNSASLTTESVGTLLGPLVGGAIVATADPGTAFAVAAGAYLFAALLLAQVRVEGRLGGRQAGGDRSIRRELGAGFRVVLREPQPRLLVALFGAQTLARGALNVLLVVSVFRLLHVGEGWVGILTAAIGAGGLVGAFGAATLVGRPLGRAFGMGLLLWGIPIALLAASANELAALVLLAIIGIGNSVEDVAGFTLLQRLVRDDVLARMLGVSWGVNMAAVAVGSLLAPLLVDDLGLRGALVATGGFLVLLTVLAWPRLLAIDAAAVDVGRELDLLKGVPMFAPLPVAAKEYIAEKLVSERAAQGTRIVEEGGSADRFYLVVDGEIEVTKGGRQIAHQGAGTYFGEIALLRDVPRTATVTAVTDTQLYSLGRDDFLAAATAHAAGIAAGNAVVTERLHGYRGQGGNEPRTRQRARR